MTITTMIFIHRPRVSLAQFTVCSWRHNRLLMTSQRPDNCDAITWIVISNSLNIDFIRGGIQGLSFKIKRHHIFSCGFHYGDVIMGAIASQITSLTIVYSTVYSDADQRKHQSSASLAFVRGIHRGPVNSPHKWPVTRQMFPFDDVIMAR